jgi:lactoylglutathione lyase
VPEFEFSVNFVGFVDSLPEGELERKRIAFSTPGIIELVQHYGTEKQEGKIYCNGNEEVGKGYGHFAVLVDDVASACERFRSLGVVFAKELKEGPYHTFAFITDPDGYFIEVQYKQDIKTELS